MQRGDTVNYCARHCLPTARDHFKPAGVNHHVHLTTNALNLAFECLDSAVSQFDRTGVSWSMMLASGAR
jgi:hypothetical protein